MRYARLALTLCERGIASFRRLDGDRETPLPTTGIRIATRVVSSDETPQGEDGAGIVWELSIPREYIDIENNEFSFYFTMENTDHGVTYPTDRLYVGEERLKSTWLKIKLK